MNISIIGSGHVGLVTGTCFAEKGHRVICVDNNQQKIARLKAGQIPIYEPGLEAMIKRNRKAKRLSFSTRIKDGVLLSELIFIAVGTPLGKGGAADLSQVETVSREIARYVKQYKVIIEKSTAPVATAEKIKNTIRKSVPAGIGFDIVSNPEFLQEGSAIQTTMHPDRIVIGVETKRAEMIMRRLYAPFKAPLIITDLKSAELIKHAANSFLAMKISYINAIANICELAGADVKEVARGIGMDKRIGTYFLNAGIGYGGYCLPKDVEAFARVSQELGYDFALLKEVQRINRGQRVRFIKKIEKELRIIKGKRIGLLGLSFKPGTDDIRESPALDIARRLVEKGARLQVYDPKAIPPARTVLPKGVRYCKTPYQAAAGTHCLVIATEWDEFKRLNLKRLRKLMAHPTIIDGRNIFEPERMRKLGFVYHCIGRV